MSTSLEIAAVSIDLNCPDRDYTPGDPLEARIEIAPHQAVRLRSAELSVVWYTAGKGDEDLHVHDFVRTTFSGQSSSEQEDAEEVPHLEISTQLPSSPLSYAGVIVKVCWAVRVRLFDTQGRQSLIEMPFQLGAVDTPDIEIRHEPEVGAQV